jgi:hypothetical protein
MEEQFAELVVIAERVRRLAQDMQGPGPSELQKLLNDIGESQRQLVGLNESDSEYTQLVHKIARLREIYDWGRNRGDGSPSVETIRMLSLLVQVCDNASNSSGSNREHLFQDAYNMILKFSKKNRLPRMSKYNRDLLLKTMDRARRLISNTRREPRYNQRINEVKLWIEGLTVAKELPGVVTFWTRLSDGSPWKTDDEYIEFINDKIQKYKDENGISELSLGVSAQQGLFHLETVCEWYANSHKGSLEDVLASFFAVDFLITIGVDASEVKKLKDIMINFIVGVNIMKEEIPQMKIDVAGVVDCVERVDDNVLLEYGVPLSNKKQMVTSIENIRDIVASSAEIKRVVLQDDGDFKMFWTRYGDGRWRTTDPIFIETINERLLDCERELGRNDFDYADVDERVYYIYDKIRTWWHRSGRRHLETVLSSFFAVEFYRKAVGGDSSVDEVEKIFTDYISGVTATDQDIVIATNTKISEFGNKIREMSSEYFNVFRIPEYNRSIMERGINGIMGWITLRFERNN